jgi:hypothetical protein
LIGVKGIYLLFFGFGVRLSKFLQFEHSHLKLRFWEKDMSSDDSTRGEINLALPGNPRYQPRALQDIFGYDNLYRGVGEVELATFDVLGEIGVIPDDQARAIDGVRERILDIYTTEVDRIERKVTGHDIRAWVKEAQRILREAGKGTVGRWIHVPLTSYDPINTGSMILFRRAHEFRASKSSCPSSLP